jgi:hypothetical protein
MIFVIRKKKSQVPFPLFLGVKVYYVYVTPKIVKVVSICIQ